MSNIRNAIAILEAAGFTADQLLRAWWERGDIRAHADPGETYVTIRVPHDKLPALLHVKAWIVEEPKEGMDEVVFAETRGKAIRASEYYEGYDYTLFRARRAPQFDQYAAAGKVPKAVLMEYGWWFLCVNCSKQTDKDNGVALDDDTVLCNDCLVRRKEGANDE